MKSLFQKMRENRQKLAQKTTAQKISDKRYYIWADKSGCYADWLDKAPPGAVDCTDMNDYKAEAVFESLSQTIDKDIRRQTQ